MVTNADDFYLRENAEFSDTHGMINVNGNLTDELSYQSNNLFPISIIVSPVVCHMDCPQRLPEDIHLFDEQCPEISERQHQRFIFVFPSFLPQ